MILQALIFSLVIIYEVSADTSAECYSDEVSGYCTQRYDCLESITMDLCDRGQVCCPIQSIASIDRKMTVLKTTRVKIRRPIIKIRTPYRSMIRRRKRKPSISKHSMFNRLKHNQHKKLTTENPLSFYYNKQQKRPEYANLPQSYNKYHKPGLESSDYLGIYGDMPIEIGSEPASGLGGAHHSFTGLSGLATQNGLSGAASQHILSSQRAVMQQALASQNVLSKPATKHSMPSQYGLSSSASHHSFSNDIPVDLTSVKYGLFADSPVDLGAGKPAENDVPMYPDPDEPEIFRDSDLFHAMFKPTKSKPLSSRRTAELKCDEYRKVTTETIAELSKYGMVPKKIERCSLANMNSEHQIGIARSGEFPHVAGLGYDDDGDTVWGCSGSLISEYYVLTAAHCCYTPIGRPVKVELGKVRLGDVVSSQEMRISEIHVHPLYNATGRYNDIALIRLAKKVRFSDKARPACLQTSRYYDENAIGTHWEPTETMSLEVRLKTNLSTHRFSDDSEAVGLRKSPYTILDNTECGIPHDTTDSLLCTRTPAPGPSCSSEGGGGGLQVRQGANKCLYSLIGISSMKSCEEPSMSIYTRISHFLPWIESIVWT